MKQTPPEPNPMYVPGALIGTSEAYLSYASVVLFGSEVNNAGLYVCDFTEDSPGVVVASLRHVRHADPVLLILQPAAIGWIFADWINNDLYNALIEGPILK